MFPIRLCNFDLFDYFIDRARTFRDDLFIDRELISRFYPLVLSV